MGAIGGWQSGLSETWAFGDCLEPAAASLCLAGLGILKPGRRVPGVARVSCLGRGGCEEGIVEPITILVADAPETASTWPVLPRSHRGWAKPAHFETRCASSSPYGLGLASMLQVHEASSRQAACRVLERGRNPFPGPGWMAWTVSSPRADTALHSVSPDHGPCVGGMLTFSVWGSDAEQPSGNPKYCQCRQGSRWSLGGVVSIPARQAVNVIG